MGQLAYDYEGRVDELAEYLEGRILSYLPAQGRDNPAPGQVAVSVNWHPMLFPWNMWPVQGATELYQDGESAYSEQATMPGVISVGWRVHALSLVPQKVGGQWTIKWDGRQAARDRCRKVFGNWREAFLGDTELQSRTRNLRVGRAEAGDKDRMGTFYEEVTSVGTRIIWIHQCEALVYL